MTEEIDLQKGLQTQIQSLDEFNNEYVVINDGDLFDAPIGISPIFVINNSDDFDALQASGNRSNGKITIPGTLAIRIGSGKEKWKKTLDEFRDVRQVIINHFDNVTGARSLGLEAVMVVSLSPGSRINPDDSGKWVGQEINFNLELF